MRAGPAPGSAPRTPRRERRCARLAHRPRARRVDQPAGRRACPARCAPVLEAHGYGLLQLPPGDHGALLAVIADQIAEYAHHGYAVVAVGLRGESAGGLHWRSLAALLRRRGVRLPPRHHVDRAGVTQDEERRLASFLDTYDLPVEEWRRWRV